jgi:hypothetical protein
MLFKKIENQNNILFALFNGVIKMNKRMKNNKIAEGMIKLLMENQTEANKL